MAAKERLRIDKVQWVDGQHTYKFGVPVLLRCQPDRER
jgi:hypothetical protein